MFDYLVDHALANVWCTPDQDKQAIVRPARLTPLGGVWNKVEVLWRMHNLPLPATRFHVYQIGQLNPYLMGLFPTKQEWVSLAEACNEKKLIVDLYADSGVQMPRCESWFMVTADDNLILAVKSQPLVPINLDTEPLYLRVYTNAYFNSLRATGTATNNYIRVEGKTCLYTADILALQQRFNVLNAMEGEVYAFVNGMRVSTIDLFTVNPGDIAELVYDSSIIRVVDFVISNLQTFTSILDAKAKYLMHYAGNDGEIFYQDDVDFFLLHPETNGRFKGVYYHRNQVDAIRMVTHKDYSIPVPYLVGLASRRIGWPDTAQLTIRLHIRKSGYMRPLVNETNRIEELYKLDSDAVINAMAGVDSTVPEWRAEHLENAAYVQIMRSNIIEVTPLLVESAYGYNAISKILGDTPTITHLKSGDQVIDVSYGLQQNSTAYEYDADAKLLGWHRHSFGSVYTAANPNCRLVEMITGLGDTVLDEVYGQQQMVIDPSVDYRMYMCSIVGGHPDNKWVDVTGSGLYAKINNRLTWFTDPTEVYTLVRGDRSFLAYSLALPMHGGILRFSLTHIQDRGTPQNYIMQIPMGSLDVFLNKHALVEGVDFIVQFPEITIINKKYLIDPENIAQTVDIRFTVFCKDDLTREVPADIGFVKNGVLSNNNRFDIRDDKVLRIVVGGGTYHRSQLVFAETDSGIRVPNVSNGQPYQVRDIVIPTRGLTTTNALTLRDNAQVTDVHVHDYLSLRLPGPVYTDPSPIAELYPVYSPFCSSIIHDLANGVLNDPRLNVFYNDNDVIDICKGYESLLKFDPTTEAHRLNSDYVIVHPHNLDTAIQLNVVQYKFLKRVVKLYLKDAVDLAPFIQMT